MYVYIYIYIYVYIHVGILNYVHVSYTQSCPQNAASPPNPRRRRWARDRKDSQRGPPHIIAIVIISNVNSNGNGNGNSNSNSNNTPELSFSRVSQTSQTPAALKRVWSRPALSRDLPIQTFEFRPVQKMTPKRNIVCHGANSRMSWWRSAQSRSVSSPANGRKDVRREMRSSGGTSTHIYIYIYIHTYIYIYIYIYIHTYIPGLAQASREGLGEGPRIRLLEGNERGASERAAGPKSINTCWQVSTVVKLKKASEGIKFERLLVFPPGKPGDETTRMSRIGCLQANGGHWTDPSEPPGGTTHHHSRRQTRETSRFVRVILAQGPC